MREILTTAFGPGLFMAVIFGGLFGIGIGLGLSIFKWECEGVSRGADRRTTYDLLAGCYVEDEGRMITLDAFRAKMKQAYSVEVK